jgi:hypothetical protein
MVRCHIFNAALFIDLRRRKRRRSRRRRRRRRRRMRRTLPTSFIFIFTTLALTC